MNGARTNRIAVIGAGPVGLAARGRIFVAKGQTPVILGRPGSPSARTSARGATSRCFAVALQRRSGRARAAPPRRGWKEPDPDVLPDGRRESSGGVPCVPGSGGAPRIGRPTCASARGSVSVAARRVDKIERRRDVDAARSSSASAHISAGREDDAWCARSSGPRRAPYGVRNPAGRERPLPRGSARPSIGGHIFSRIPTSRIDRARLRRPHGRWSAAAGTPRSTRAPRSQRSSRPHRRRRTITWAVRRADVGQMLRRRLRRMRCRAAWEVSGGPDARARRCRSHRLVTGVRASWSCGRRARQVDGPRADGRSARPLRRDRSAPPDSGRTFTMLGELRPRSRPPPSRARASSRRFDRSEPARLAARSGPHRAAEELAIRNRGFYVVGHEELRAGPDVPDADGATSRCGRWWPPSPATWTPPAASSSRCPETGVWLVGRPALRQTSGASSCCLGGAGGSSNDAVASAQRRRKRTPTEDSRRVVKGRG